MYQLKLTEGAARRGALTTVHGTVPDAGLYECGDGGCPSRAVFPLMT